MKGLNLVEALNKGPFTLIAHIKPKKGLEVHFVSTP